MHLSSVMSKLTSFFRYSFKHFNQVVKKFPDKISWKSPPVIGGLFIFIVLIGTFAFYQAVPNHQSIPNQQKGLEANESPSLDSYELKVNDSVVAVLPTKEDIDKVLQEYQDYYAKPAENKTVSSVSFAEKVTSEKAEAGLLQVQTPDQVLKMLIDGKTITQDYTVQPNDSWCLIARKTDMLTKEVLAGNSGATENTKIVPGQIIKLVSVAPYLTVISKGTCTDTETIQCDTVTKVDQSLGNGQTKVLTQGSNGSKLVTYSYEQNNGNYIKTEVLNEEIIKSPESKVVAQGPASRAVNFVAVSRGSGDYSSIKENAISLVGARYVFGGSSQNGFDCSGFTKYVYSLSGISLPRTSFDQFASGTAISRDELQPGDLVFFTTYAKGASHVGIYVGDGRFVHAENPRVGVIISSLNDFSSCYLGARRYY